MRDLYARLRERGFDGPFIRSFVLPEWWEDGMAEVEANRALAEGYLAKQLGFDLLELHDTDATLSLPEMAHAQFKRLGTGEADDRLKASALVGQRAAKAVTRAVRETVPMFSGPQTAQAIREAILRVHKVVDLNSLLAFSWKTGIAVLHVAQKPASGKSFDGMATFIGNRPAIVLASGRDASPWLAFHLAHELGHIMLGHVGPDTEPLIDGDIASTTRSTNERQADQYACEVLTGFPKPKVRDLQATGLKLAFIAQQSGPEQGVDPGVYALIYAKSNDRWGVAQKALGFLDLNSGGRDLINAYLDRRLKEADLSDSDERFLTVLRAA